ncbi:MAG: GAF domain-containing protein, partial [Caldithrix sp.]|nr:GAF domain-containing protein [Caldithrix sp.]
ILSFILGQLIHETGAEVGAFIQYDTKTDKLIPKTILTSDQKEANKDDVAFSSTIFRKVLNTKEAVLSFDTRSDDNIQGTRSMIINRIHAILAFPLIIKNTVYGIMYLDSRENRQSFNEASRQFLSFFAPIASLTLEQILNKRRFENENVLLKNQLESIQEIPSMVGESPVMQQLFRLIHKVAQSDASVIITGENGTGKDLAARAIHELSPRKDNPYIAQYIGNIPNSILESELFGYKKGAFTGANSDKMGLFEAVNNGTLFLDEIGDLSPELQAKMLRVLQNKEIKRLGENTVRYVDVRIIAATNRDLAQMVKRGEFRQDLYYRLNVVNIHVPPLRERKQDIPLLIDHIMRKEGDESNKTISKPALKKLLNYHWPGNVRQLENIIRRAAILTTSSQIEAEDIQFDELDDESSDILVSKTMEQIKKMVIRQRIEYFEGNKTRAAESLDISLRSLQSKAKEMGL